MSGQVTDIKRRISCNLDSAMTAAGVTSAELARRLGLNEKTVRRWRAGEVMPNAEALARAASELGTDAMTFYMPPVEQEAAV